MLIEVEVYPRVLFLWKPMAPSPIFGMFTLGKDRIPLSGMTVICLKDKINETKVPIFIDCYTADAISVALSGLPNVRPQTHDLFKSFLVDDCGIVVTKAVVTELKEGTFYALVHYVKDGEPHTKDSRPSDAIALATLFSAPIFVEETLWLEMIDDPNTKSALEQFEGVEHRSISPEDPGASGGYVQ